MKKITLLFCFFANLQFGWAQKLHLFSQEIKKEYPSVVYDFLERYLYEIDSLMKCRVNVNQKLQDDKVIFLSGDVSSVHNITEQSICSISKVDEKYYQVSWSDANGGILLVIAFPMQYELLLGKPKAEIEKDFNSTLHTYTNYNVRIPQVDKSLHLDDGCVMCNPVSNYYVESLNTATYSRNENGMPTFSDKDKWHSAANLFQGCIKDIEGYTLYIEQNLYGFKKKSYVVPLVRWLAYCQAMKLKVYFAIEEEREDGLKGLLVAHCQELGFNHMMSLIIPDKFVNDSKCVIKATLNAYIPTQNVKNLYQQYVDKPRKRI